MAAAQLFTYSDLVITQGSKFYALAQADVLENFYGLSESYERLATASRLAKLCDRVIMEHEPCDDILLLLLYGLRALCRGRPPEIVTAAFGLKFLEFNGLTPACTFCAVCGERLCAAAAGKLGAYPAGLGGLCCAGCAAENGQTRFRLGEGARRAAEYVLSSDNGKVFSFEADPHVSQSLINYTDALIAELLR